MKIILHNLLNGSNETFEGDRTTTVRQIGEKYPWLVEWGDASDIEKLLRHIGQNQFLAVEVVDDREHPLAR